MEQQFTFADFIRQVMQALGSVVSILDGTRD